MFDELREGLIDSYKHRAVTGAIAPRSCILRRDDPSTMLRVDDDSIVGPPSPDGVVVDGSGPPQIISCPEASGGRAVPGARLK